VLTANAIVFAKRMLSANGYANLLNSPDALEYSIPGAAEIFSTLTFTHGMGVFDDLILNTPSWSISTEFYTYLLFATLCLLLDGRIRLVAFCILGTIGFLVSVGASANVHNCVSQGGCLSLTYDFGFARTIYSFFLGALTFHASRVMRFNPNILQLTGVAVLLLLFSLVDVFPAVAFAFPVTFALLILSVHSDKGWLAAIFSTSPLQVLGQRSYSIYLMHMPLILFFENIAKRVDGSFSSAIVLLFFVAVLVLLSGWTYRFIEDPFRVMFNRVATGFGAYRAGAAN
jgi:peptidoglycan/LPS O-acetylase OafA/YrhL